MNHEMLHSVILIFTVILSFLASRTSLAEYDLQITAGAFVLFFLAKRFILSHSRSRLIESVVFTFLVLFTVNSTGGIDSPYFFLLYFLLFSLSLLLEPVISIVLTLALMVFFILSLPHNQPITSLLPVFSLAFLTPFALLMGQEYTEVQRSKVKVQKLESTLENKQEETYLFLSLMIKNHLKSINRALDNFMGDHDLHEIKKHVRNMEKQIDKFEKQ